MKLLEVNNLTTVFNTDDGEVQAVNNISFSLDKGETLGIVGESGCGKSVTCMTLMGLIPTPPGKIKSGQAFFKGKDLLTMNKQEIRKIRGNEISMIFQDPMTSLNPFLKISTQLTEVLTLHRKMKKKEALEFSVEMLSKVGINNPHKRINSYPHEFSGGMRQRVMIAMSLLTNPDLLIADEPTTALDVTIQAGILELLKGLQKELGMSLIIITHDLGVVAGMADRIIVMYAGSIVEENNVYNLFKSPKHPYTADLLKSIPKISEPVKEDLFSIPGNPPNLINMPDACPFYPRCQFAKDICKNKMPDLNKAQNNGSVRCYFPLNQ